TVFVVIWFIRGPSYIIFWLIAPVLKTGIVLGTIEGLIRLILNELGNIDIYIRGSIFATGQYEYYTMTHQDITYMYQSTQGRRQAQMNTSAQYARDLFDNLSLTTSLQLKALKSSQRDLKNQL
ncbi:hypothetical protein ACJX0J_006833, partial [Zea mays]